jgi:K+-sensing histidine kinase KdpD
VWNGGEALDGRPGPAAGDDLADVLDDLLHDLRTPLAAIRGAAEIILESGEDEVVRAEFTRAIIAEAQRMDRFIVAALARLRTG